MVGKSVSSSILQRGPFGVRACNASLRNPALYEVRLTAQIVISDECGLCGGHAWQLALEFEAGGFGCGWRAAGVGVVHRSM
jgi:hypothetical protein